MKEFNLEAAKAGKPVCTRDGRKARILTFDLNGYNGRSIVAAVTHKDGREVVHNFFSNGHVYYNDTITPTDLMIVSEKKKGWIPIAWFGENKRGLLIFDTKEEAEAYYKDDTDNCIVDIIPIEWEE